MTITDANLCLGRLLPEYFPRIFGPGEDQPLCRDTVARAFQAMAADIATFTASTAGDTGDTNTNDISVPTTPRALQRLSVEEVAMGFVRVANEAMCRPIRALTQVGGHGRCWGFLVLLVSPWGLCPLPGPRP